jgi:hypothetical protein
MNLILAFRNFANAHKKGDELKVFNYVVFY